MTKREFQILILLSEGLTAKEIAVKLNISFRTVEWHKDNMIYWFEAKNTPHMIQIAYQEGLIKRS